MPAYNFQARFAELVATGRKKQTIRARRRDGREPRVGQRFVAYAGMRTKHCRQLVTSTISEVLPIEMWGGGSSITVGGSCLTSDSANELALRDGFRHINEMVGWFIENHGRGRFVGHVIRWR